MQTVPVLKSVQESKLQKRNEKKTDRKRSRSKSPNSKPPKERSRPSSPVRDSNLKDLKDEKDSKKDLKEGSKVTEKPQETEKTPKEKDNQKEIEKKERKLLNEIHFDLLIREIVTKGVYEFPFTLHGNINWSMWTDLFFEFVQKMIPDSKRITLEKVFKDLQSRDIHKTPFDSKWIDIYSEANIILLVFFLQRAVSNHYGSYELQILSHFILRRTCVRLFVVIIFLAIDLIGINRFV